MRFVLIALGLALAGASLKSSFESAEEARVPDDAPELSKLEFDLLLDACSRKPLDRDNLAYETLLYHGARTLELVRQHGTGPLDAAGSGRLLRELSRTHAWLEVRMVNEDGVVRAELSPERVPLGIKQHLFPEHVLDVQVPEVSGTVKRVGVDHLWARL